MIPIIFSVNTFPVLRAMHIFKHFTFHSAHFLPHTPEGHPCRNMHGHTYLLVVYLSGEPDEHTGWIMDFGELKALVKPVVQLLDHQVINTVPGLENPTCERVAQWFWEQLKPIIPPLSKVVLHETPTSGVEYCG